MNEMAKAITKGLAQGMAPIEQVLPGMLAGAALAALLILGGMSVLLAGVRWLGEGLMVVGAVTLAATGIGAWSRLVRRIGQSGERT